MQMSGAAIHAFVAWTLKVQQEQPHTHPHAPIPELADRQQPDRSAHVRSADRAGPGSSLCIRQLLGAVGTDGAVAAGDEHLRRGN